MDTDKSKENMTLADLPIGKSATIIKVLDTSKGEKKFADIGIVPNTKLLMEAHAPFGGLLRIKIMGTSMALHSSDARNIIISQNA